MRYIRTKDGKLKIEYRRFTTHNGKVLIDTADEDFFYEESQILKEAETIEDLCDELVVVQKDFHDLLNADTHCLQTLKRYYEINKIEVLGIYGAIWTEWGLKYVAKMNNEGKLELL